MITFIGDAPVTERCSRAVPVISVEAVQTLILRNLCAERILQIFQRTVEAILSHIIIRTH